MLHESNKYSPDDYHSSRVNKIASLPDPHWHWQPNAHWHPEPDWYTMAVTPQNYDDERVAQSLEVEVDSGLGLVDSRLVDQPAA